MEYNTRSRERQQTSATGARHMAGAPADAAVWQTDSMAGQDSRRNDLATTPNGSHTFLE